MTITKFKTEAAHEVFQCQGDKKGSNLLVFGAIHGDEVCGTRALQQIIQDIEKGDLVITTGRFTCVPICNIEGHRQNKRLIDKNLNRIFFKTENDPTLEAQYANALLPLMDDQDYFVDLHSTSGASPVFAFDDYETPETAFLIDQVVCPYVLYGWNDIYNDDGVDGITTNDAAAQKNVPSILIECGQHQDPVAISVAKQNILNVMVGLGMISKKHSYSQEKKPIKIRMTDVFFKHDADGVFTQEWAGFDFIKKSTVITRKADGSALHVAQDDTYVVMASPTADVGTEWFCLGVRD